VVSSQFSRDKVKNKVAAIIYSAYLLILVGGDRGEFGFGEVEGVQIGIGTGAVLEAVKGGQRLSVRRRVQVGRPQNVHAWLIFVH